MSIPSRALAKKLFRHFPQSAVNRGYEYFARGTVGELVLSEFNASADVTGSKMYRAKLDWEGTSDNNVIRAWCTCPFFQNGNPCKHLWAFVLKLDREGISQSIPLRTSVRLGLMDGDDDDDDDGGGEYYEEDFDESNEDEVSPPKRNWRDAFRQPAKKLESRYQPSVAPSVYMTLESEAWNEESVKLKFFVSEKTYSGEINLRALSLPNNGQVKLKDAQLESALRAISIMAMDELKDLYRYAGHFPDPTSRTLNVRSLRFLLGSLLSTEKVFASRADLMDALKSKKITHLTAAQFSSLKIKIDETDSDFSLSGVVSLNAKEFVAIGELKHFAEPNLFKFERHIGFLDLSIEEKAWFDELSNGALMVPKEDSQDFLETLVNQTLDFELPSSLQWPRTSIKPKAKLYLTAEKAVAAETKPEKTLAGNPLSRYVVDLKLQYGSRLVSHNVSKQNLADGEEKKIYARDLEEESRLFSLLPLDLAFTRLRDDETIYLVTSKNLAEFVKATIAAGIPTVVDNRLIQEAGDFKISVSSGVDWFDVNGQANFDGRWVKFPTILEAMAGGETFIPLPDGSTGIIGKDMANRLQRLAAFAESTKDGFRFNKSQGLILNSLLESEKNVELDADFEKLREKIKSFAGIKPSEAPRDFQGRLRKYQKDGLGWLCFLETYGLGGILADDMGLGKTIQCLAFLDSRRVAKTGEKSPSLLLAPKSLLSNWQTEAAKFTPKMQVYIHAGLGREASQAHFNKQDLIVTTYHTMLRDLEAFKEIGWDCVILDEAQAIKNPQALISKAAKNLPSKFRLAMTGTPIENSIQDLFSISDFVNPGFLNGKKRGAHLKLGDDLRESLARAFKPILLRRTKEQVLKDLPDKTEQLISVELEAKQLKVYNELKRFYQSQLMTEIKEKGVNKSKIKILAALTRLRQAALHTGLIDPAHIDTKSAKFEVVLEMLDEVIAEGHRVLIFSQFTSLLALLKTELDQRKIQYSYLDGKTTKRHEVVGAFKTTDVPVFLMSLKAGGVGLNLVEADYVFLLDPWWNPAVEAQAIDRVHRIGQKRAVNAYRFIAKNTVEEKIIELQQAKKGISAELFGQKSNLIRNLTAMDIENLLA